MEARRGWEVISPFQDAGGRKEGGKWEGGREGQGRRAREEEVWVFISTRMDATRHLGFNEGNCTGSRLMGVHGTGSEKGSGNPCMALVS